MRSLLAMAIVLAGPANAGVVDRVAAVVDDTVIALSEVYDLGSEYIGQRCPMADAGCVHDMEREVLDALIKRVLVQVELEKLGMRVTGQEIDQSIDQIVKDNGLEDRADLRAQLEKDSIAWDTFRQDMADRMRLQRFQQVVLLPRVVVSDDEVQDAYMRTARNSREVEAVLDAMGVIIPPDADEEATAEVIAQTEAMIAALNAGEADWDESVAVHDAAGLAEIVGGRAYPQGQLTPEVDAVAFEGEVGKVHGPVRVGNVLFVIRINDRGFGEERVVPFEEVEEQLRNSLFQERMVEAEAEWYERARRLTAVDVLLEEPQE